MSSEYQDIKNNQTILEHGQDVARHFQRIFEYLSCVTDDSTPDYPHPIPKWLLTHRNRLFKIYSSHLDDILSYLLYHDCGKPLCLIIDNEQRRHFPHHEEISKATFLQHSNNTFIANLIGNDLLCHTTKPKDYLDISETDNIEILLGAALASLHSNATLFGGFNSDSFKIKFKNLEKLGERILNHKQLKGQPNE